MLKQKILILLNCILHKYTIVNLLSQYFENIDVKSGSLFLQLCKISIFFRSKLIER